MLVVTTFVNGGCLDQKTTEVVTYYERPILNFQTHPQQRLAIEGLG